ncbi:hypothetical protein ED236_07400 [Pseudomethylobacillus aquaticus]|uniref:Uncharacterized protein n=1 Tax=Pseudomethylobacillus aquaticus TaxID=2676064 RepID=A0A3N0V0C1_9PROT|nr:hypothetical protein [Pseudomethylobacillus aquaticus]ROH86256.1 hypothetical protein ED236_07400 [Pseudomethylobacillus aquaticus]
MPTYARPRHIVLSALFTGLVALSNASFAGVLPEAQTQLKITLAQQPTSRPMTVAYLPEHRLYVVGDGGLGPIPGDYENTQARSLTHIYDEEGRYKQSVKTGISHRAVYFNEDTRRIESVTYNVSTQAGFSPNTGVFALQFNDAGELLPTTTDIHGFNPAFGSASTMPSYDPVSKRYLAKQERSNEVWLVELDKREKVGEIKLDLAAAGAKTDDISEHFVAYTGIPGEELALLDVDHRSILVYNIEGKFVGKSALPKNIKLRAQNHYNGLGYTRGMFFVYHESEGEFGTYYGFKISDKAQ